jgi:ABC-type spermidine/putrescine transport system permease subunit II
MTKLKRVLKWGMFALIFLFLGVPLLLVTINAFNEELKPEAVAFADFSGEEEARVGRNEHHELRRMIFVVRWVTALRA